MTTPGICPRPYVSPPPATFVERGKYLASFMLSQVSQGWDKLWDKLRGLGGGIYRRVSLADGTVWDNVTLYRGRGVSHVLGTVRDSATEKTHTQHKQSVCLMVSVPSSTTFPRVWGDTGQYIYRSRKDPSGLGFKLGYVVE